MTIRLEDIRTPKTERAPTYGQTGPSWWRRFAAESGGWRIHGTALVVRVPSLAVGGQGGRAYWASG